MKITPWTHRERRPSAFTEDFWRDLWGDGREGMVNRLPEVFRTRNSPAVNVLEDEGFFVITMDCPGLEENDFEIQAMGNHLVIGGERKWEKEKKGKEFHRVESQYGSFERSVELPANVRLEPEKIDAEYKKGVLTIRVPKVEKTPVKKIPVHTG